MRAIIREIDPGDINFVLNSFMRSLRNYPAYKNVPNEVYYPHQKKVLGHLLKNKTVLVLCNSELPDQIFGYIIGSKNIETNYVYIKYPYRKFGFATKLMHALHPDLGNRTLIASYTCRDWPTISQKYRHVYNPFMEDMV